MVQEPQITIKEVCHLLNQGKQDEAARVINKKYPFKPIQKSSRQYTPREMTKVFLRDGFIDRYYGTKLIYPPTLRIISHYLPNVFPYHKNGKMDKGHIAYWKLFPTIDHVVPVSRGGVDDESNWVCCSMLTNSAKSHWLLEELDWELQEPGNLACWDGLWGWFMQHVESNPHFLTDHLCKNYFKKWFNAARDVANQLL